MRQVSTHEYETAKAALAAYSEFCKPYVQKNGWTVIPADAPRPVFQGAELSTDRINEFSAAVELFEIARDTPEKLFAYITADKSGCWRVTTWTGETLSADLIAGRPYRNPRPSYTSNTVTPIKAHIAGRWYSGRALGAGIYVKLRRCKAA